MFVSRLASVKTLYSPGLCMLTHDSGRKISEIVLATLSKAVKGNIKRDLAAQVNKGIREDYRRTFLNFKTSSSLAR